MEKVKLIFSAALITAMIVTTSCGSGASKEEVMLNEASPSNEVSTASKPSTSNEVTIGNQLWMAENLNVDKFRNGDAIPHVISDQEWAKSGGNRQPAWCYYDNDPANGEKYGKLYNWYAANDPRGLAPEGWHIPSDKEWTLLTDNLGGEDVAGKKSKSIRGWKDGGNGTNESGFSGLPGGERGGSCRGDDCAAFLFVGISGSWWSSTEDSPSNAGTRNLYSGKGTFFRDYNNKASAKSIRCLRD